MQQLDVVDLVPNEEELISTITRALAPVPITRIVGYIRRYPQTNRVNIVIYRDDAHKDCAYRMALSYDPDWLRRDHDNSTKEAIAARMAYMLETGEHSWTMDDYYKSYLEQERANA